MLPKQLTIQGLYSYQDRQTIDFARLTEAGIFGIFGAVGSGKSSILEAIGFALYGKTERLNDRENRNYNMMNLKSNELLIDFEFEHYDHTRYRFVVKGKRNSKKFQDVKTFNRSAYKWENDEWIPLESADATQLLDLSYENFRRTIIIPQGKFQEFLQLGNTERTKMMMDIFHLHRYDLFDKVKKLETENDLNIANLQGQLTNYNNSDENELLAKQEQLKETQSNEKIIKEKIVKLESDYQSLNKLKEQFDLLNTYRTNCQELEKQKPFFEEKQKRLEAFQQAKLYFEPSLLRKKVLEKIIKKRNEDLLKNNASIGKINENIRRQSEQWEVVQKDYAQLDAWRQQVLELQTAQDICQYQLQSQELQEKINAGKKLIEKEEKNTEQLSQQYETIEKKIQQTKAEQPSNIFVFQEIGEWFQQKKSYQKQLDNWQEQAAKLQQRMANGKNIFPTLSFSFDNWQQESETQKNQYQQAIANLQEEKNKLSIKSGLHQYARNLQDGEPCPLCGAIHHPNKLEDDTQMAHSIQQIEQKITANKYALSTLENNTSKASQYAAQINSFEEQIQDFSNNIISLKQTLDTHQAQFRWTDFDANNENDFLEKKQAAEKNIATINQSEKELPILKKQLDNSTETLYKYQNALTERQAQYDAAIGHMETLASRLQWIGKETLHQYTKEQYAQQKTELERKVSDTKHQYESLHKDLQELDKNKAVLIAESQSIEQEKEKETTELQSIQTHIEQLLKQHLTHAEQDIWDILQQNIDIPKGNAEISQFQNQLFAATEKRTQLGAQLKDQYFDEARWQQLNEELQIAKASLNSYTAIVVQLTQTIELLRDNLARKKQLTQQLDEKILRKDNIQTMKGLFRESGFVNYISSVYLKNLCIAANERFSKLTHNQLHLELSESNEFLVRDLINDGKTRSAKTLSGGQTFQASLCLALALADSVQYQNKSEQNFFFLDEGFGSLDKDSLATIYETLKSLRRENRIVGIISHVEDLQQEIPLSVTVTNDAEKGSQIEV
ncbi:MAG: SMC family ATPase [Chitinophagaceae bacterium]